jgi:hypothetical protein
MWEAATNVAKQEGFSLDPVKDPLLTLFQGRVPLVTNDNDLNKARAAAATVVATMIRGAQNRSFHVLAPFFLNEALFKLHPLWPLVD